MIEGKGAVTSGSRMSERHKMIVNFSQMGPRSERRATRVAAQEPSGNR